MKIEEKGKLNTFEPMPTEAILYLTAVQYSGGYWAAGPAGMDKNEVIKQLQTYSGIEVARIYEAKVPVKSLPSA